MVENLACTYQQAQEPLKAKNRELLSRLLVVKIMHLLIFV